MSTSLPRPPASRLSCASPVSASLPVPPVMFSMLRSVSSATPPTVTVAAVAPLRVTATAAVFSL
jgi:hypothetical protein